MSWAFWRDRRAGSARNTGADDAREQAGTDPAAQLHARTRRRLIGAAALLLAAVILLPMVLDPTPKPIPDSVAIDIPSDKTPFTPRLSPPAPAAAPAVVPTPPVAEAPAKKAAPAPSTEAPRSAEAPAAKAPAASANTTASSNPAASGSAHFALQAAALSSEAAARDLLARLKKEGFSPYTEKISTRQGDRIRVRVGPYATRDEAEQARTRLKALGIQAEVVSG
ncbi:MAG: SPOR domain-containing protein [Gemmatimonadota bacterium]